MKFSDKQIAGTMFIILALFGIAVWAVLLLIGNPTHITPFDNLMYVFSSQNESRADFIWLAVSLALSVTVASAWWSCRVSRGLVVFVSLLSLTQGAVSLLLQRWADAALIVLPLYWVYRAYLVSKRSVRPAHEFT